MDVSLISCMSELCDLSGQNRQKIIITENDMLCICIPFDKLSQDSLSICLSDIANEYGFTECAIMVNNSGLNLHFDTGQSIYKDKYCLEDNIEIKYNHTYVINIKENSTCIIIIKKI